MDVLADILASLRLTGGVVIDAETHGDFCFESQFTPADCAAYLSSRTPDLIAYHYVRSGRVFAQVEGQPALEATEGDVILIPRNDRHLMFNRDGVEPVDSHTLVQPMPDGPAKIFVDGGGDTVELYCGFLGVSTEHHPLLDGLPALLKLDGGSGAQGQWLESSLKLLSEGGQSPEIVARLAELFFAEAIRRYMADMPASEGGWLAGLRDPAVARALGMIHKRYAEDLDIETLAREAGVSRSVLGERFVDILGEPPMRYCARWRMRMAANMLRDGQDSTANVAYAVGFNSEAAFNRAFKREYGEPPASWRRRIEAEARASGAPAQCELPVQTVGHCIAADGTSLTFSAAGAGPPLVKVANWFGDLARDWDSPIWCDWFDELTRSNRLLRYDGRGHGQSGRTPVRIAPNGFAEDLSSVVDAAQLERFDLLGLGHGATVAMIYAATHPNRVRRLVLVGGWALGWQLRDQPEDIVRREAIIELSGIGWEQDTPIYRDLYTKLYVPGASPEQVDWLNDVQRSTTTAANAVAFQRAMGKIDIRALVPTITAPTLLCHARNDRAVPFQYGEQLAALLPNATFVPLDSDNHILLPQDPEWPRFKGLLRRFLAEP